jgi:NADPH:quinone reductase-like Zn-dependent oxidoreductase
MQTISVHQFGGPEVLTVGQVPRPEPQEGEVLVRIHAAGVLPIECFVRRGALAGIVPKSLPYIPGTAFSGVIEEIGPGVTKFQKGQAVCGRAPNGTYAEYTTVQANPPAAVPNTAGYLQSASVSPLVLKPETLSFDEAATLSGGATTAWTALFEDGELQAGQRVLIHAAAGGVGLFAVQFARWKGAQVFGTASTRNLEFVRSLGAETVIDYTTTAFEDVVHDVDFVLDTVGGETLQRSLKVLRRGGTLVTVMEPAPVEQAEQLGVRAIKNAVFPTSEHLRKIVQLIDEGHARPTIQDTFSLYEAHLAHELCETGHGRGRIVLHIAD